eukprot:2825484-Alexandrium_andersonii.AAC.1
MREGLQAVPAEARVHADQQEVHHDVRVPATRAAAPASRAAARGGAPTAATAAAEPRRGGAAAPGGLRPGA